MATEFELIRKYFDKPVRNRQDGGRSASSVVLGVGDDAALLQPAAGMELAVSTDLLLEGRHFRAGTDARKLGHKALAVNLSDMAAMGAAPRWATLALALPAADEAWLDGFAKGFFALAQRFGVELIGGDTTRAPASGPLSVCITILGEVPSGLALYRAGALPGAVALAAIALFVGSSLVALTAAIRTPASSSRSSTPQVNAPCAPPPCSARLIGTCGTGIGPGGGGGAGRRSHARSKHTGRSSGNPPKE